MRSEDTQEHDHTRVTDNEFLKHKLNLREVFVIGSALVAVAFTHISHDIKTEQLVPRVDALEAQQRMIEQTYVTRDDLDKLITSLNTQSRNIVRIGEKLGVQLESP